MEADIEVEYGGKRHRVHLDADIDDVGFLLDTAVGTIRALMNHEPVSPYDDATLNEMRTKLSGS